jgi:hypothetical protein
MGRDSVDESRSSNSHFGKSKNWPPCLSAVECPALSVPVEMRQIRCMEISEAQYERIKDALPVQRGNVRLNNLQVLNAVLYVAEQGCKMARSAEAFWALAHDLYADESLVE